jgi:transcriptional regulator with XRE-family HTH domain
MTKERIATVLKARRKSKNLKVDDVAAALKLRGIEVSQKALYNYESGHRHPDADTFLALCDIYEIDDVIKTFSEQTETSGDVIVGGLVLTPEEAGLIQLFRQIPEDRRDMFRSMLEAALKSQGLL